MEGTTTPSQEAQIRPGHSNARRTDAWAKPNPPHHARIVTGGAVLARDIPTRDNTAPPESWPLSRPSSSRVDAPARSGLIPRSVPPQLKVDAPAPLATNPETSPKVDVTAPPDAVRPSFQNSIELPVPDQAAMSRSPMAGRPSVAPIPTDEFLRNVRDARKKNLAAGSASNLVLSGIGPTRTAATIEDYRNRGNQLLKRFHREQRQPIDALGFVPKDFAFWLLSLRPGIKASTWRIYRQAAIMLLSGFPHEEAQAAIELIENDAPGERAMDTGDAIPSGKIPSDRLTSARKRKFFKYDEWQRVEAHIRIKNRSDTAYLLLDWLRAGLATGLRPAEWKATNLVRYQIEGEDRVFLFVLNAKATNGRGNGAVRTLDLTALPSGTITAIERMSNLGMEAFREGNFDKLQSNCSQILYQACSRIWPRRENLYALYSCRHQFMANMKALGLPNEEVSALAGHVVDETAALSYGRKSVGWPVDKIVDRPRGVKDEIATVRRRLVMWEERQDLVAVAKYGPGETPLPPLPPMPNHDDGPRRSDPLPGPTT
jgi:hypothetical protein